METRKVLDIMMKLVSSTDTTEVLKNIKMLKQEMKLLSTTDKKRVTDNIKHNAIIRINSQTFATKTNKFDDVVIYNENESPIMFLLRMIINTKGIKDFNKSIDYIENYYKNELISPIGDIIKVTYTKH